jgi:uncharacterized protein YdeI (YjbR/CyaY-like superfamily)
MADELAELIVADAAAWRTWLGQHHGDSPGVWLVLAKKPSMAPTTLRYDEALDHALCHGWIDGQVRRRDAESYRQRFTPRRASSAWSQRNTMIAERLIASGQMHPAGLAAVSAARADGRWEAAYASPANSRVPPDLAAALAVEPRAQAMFERLSGQNRYAVLYRLQTARRAETRARWIERFVAMLARGETPHPQRRN